MWWWLLVACSSDPADSDPGETPPPIGDDDDDNFEDCVELELITDGPSEPVVGDAWLVYLYCDDALLTGPMILQLTPSSIATIDGNEVTFIAAGEATMRVQVGGYRVDETVVVAAE